MKRPTIEGEVEVNGELFCLACDIKGSRPVNIWIVRDDENGEIIEGPMEEICSKEEQEIFYKRAQRAVYRYEEYGIPWPPLH